MFFFTVLKVKKDAEITNTRNSLFHFVAFDKKCLFEYTRHSSISIFSAPNSTTYLLCNLCLKKLMIWYQDSTLVCRNRLEKKATPLIVLHYYRGFFCTGRPKFKEVLAKLIGKTQIEFSQNSSKNCKTPTP